MKALNNVMSAAGLLLASETLLLGRKHGLEPEVMLSVLNASTGRNHATETKIAPFVLSGTYASGFALDLMVKDLAIARELAREAGSPYLVGSLVTSLWELAMRQLPTGADQMELVRWLEELAGMGLAAGPDIETERTTESS
jgi:3-hydroxyisobutyrate dehydrogenase